MILIEFKEDDLTMLRGVLACAGVKDVRYYLNGIHISDRYVESTDGHRFARFKTPTLCGGPLEKGIIIPSFKIPKPIVQVVIVIGGEGAIEAHLTDKKGQTEIIKLTAIDGRYPDLDVVMPRLDDGDPPPSLVLNPHLIYDVTKAMGFKAFCPVEIKGRDMSTPYQIKIRDFPDLIFYVMPAKS